MSNLKILSWNCNGINQKIQELTTFVKLHNINIILLGETRLNPKTPLKIPNFHVYRNDHQPPARTPPHGGTAVLVRRGIVHQHVNIQTEFDSTSINVKLGNEIAQITAVYKSPGATLKSSDLDALTNHNGPFIIGGDLNAKHTDWHCLHSNKSGKTIAQHAESTNRYTIVASDSPTHYPYISTHRPDVLDLFLLDTKNLKHTLSNLCDLSSDHNPQLLTLSSQLSQSGPPSAKKRINWNKFNIELSSYIKNSHISTISDINKNLDQLTKAIQSECVKCSYTVDQPELPKPLPDDILLEIDTKRLLRKNWQRTRDPRTKTLYNAQVSHVKDILSRHRISEWNTFTATLNFQNKSIYKLNRRLLHKPPPCQPLKTPDGINIYDSKSKAELFADTMYNQFQNNPGPPLPEVANSILKLRDTNSPPSDIYVSPKEVWNIVKRLPPAKAPGEDGITNKALKHLPKVAYTLLANIYTSCFRHSYFPVQWKKAQIVMIPKPMKNHLIPENHRPISLLNTMSKIFERIILTKLINHTKIRKEQHAFRTSHSTTTQLITLVDDLKKNQSKKEKTVAVFLDVAKAFDRVWHQGLIHKLLLANIPHSLIKLIDSFLTDRTFKIKINDHLSTSRKIEAGVPQGSCLSPLLYLIYTNDFPIHNSVTVSLFADDTLLYASNHNYKYALLALQRQLDTTQDWLTKWRIQLNVSKTVAVIFGPRSKYNMKLQIQNQLLDWSHHAKYLGVTLNYNLRFEKHIRLTLQKSRGARAALYPVLNRNSAIPIPARLSIYKIYLRPIVLYAAPIWRHLIGQRTWTKIEAFQNVALRTITGAHFLVSNQNLLKSTLIPSLQDEALRLSKSLQHTLSISKYPHLSRLA